MSYISQIVLKGNIGHFFSLFNFLNVNEIKSRFNYGL